MEKRACLAPARLELLADILGRTEGGLTGTEIHRFLLQAGFLKSKIFWLSVKNYSMLLQIFKTQKDVVIIS